MSLLLLTLAACTLPAGGPRWEPVDVEAVQDRLDQPTADRAELASWLLDSAQVLALTVAAGTTLHDAVDQVAASPEAPDVDRAEGTLSGTEVYVRVACPGDGDTPDGDFARGQVQLESPLLSLEEIEQIGVRGDLLLTATACEDGELRLDGLVAAWYRAATEHLVLDGLLEVSTGSGDQDLAMVASMDTAWAFLIPLDADRTLTLTLVVDPEEPQEGTLRYDGGEVRCQLEEPVSCALD